MNEHPAHGDCEYVHVSDVGGIAVVCFKDLERAVEGCVTGEADKLARELSALVDQKGWTSIILDFENSDFMPWAAFEFVLIRLHKKLNGNLKLCNLTPNIVRYFETNRLAELFHMFSTREEALAAIKS